MCQPDSALRASPVTQALNAMYEFENEISIVAEWAKNHPLVKKAYFFGSRYKGTHRENSDIDIGVELNIGHGDEFLLSTWIHECQELKESLQALTSYKLDLQWYENQEETPDMHNYLNEASVVIFE